MSQCHKKVWTCALMVTFILLFSTFSLAQSENTKSDTSLPRLEVRHIWEIGPEISYIEYREPDIMSEKGLMYGIDAAYSYHNGVMIKVAGRFSYGQVDYQNSVTFNNIDDIIFEIRTLGGYDFKLSKSFTMTPFIGLGYRYLRDDMAGTNQFNRF